MTSLELIAKASRQYEHGIITAEEFVNKLSDSFASDPDLDAKDAVEVVGLIPGAVRGSLLRKVQAALAPTYLRRAFGGFRRTEEEERAAALRETARERAWAAALKPLLAAMEDDVLYSQDSSNQLPMQQVSSVGEVLPLPPDAFDIIDKLDFIQPLEDGGVELRIEPRPGRLDGSPTMMDLLRRKIQFYLDQLNTEGFQAVFKHPAAEKTVIVLVCDEPPVQAVMEFVTGATGWVAENNARLVLRRV